MTLHEAIVQLLRGRGSPMKTDEIAAQVNETGLYIKRDGSLVTSFQIHGRMKNYPHLFTRAGSMVGLVEWGEIVTELEASPPVEQKETIIRSHISLDQDVTKIEFLRNSGYSRIGILGQLLNRGLTGSIDLDSCGIYVISIPEDYKANFIPPEKASQVGNVIKPWSVDRLSQKWVDRVDIVYYGLAGSRSPRTLRQRINDLLRHGRGETSDRGPHKGGEILWQLLGYEDFFLWAIPTGYPPEPRQIEKQLLRTFHSQTGQLPFANRQF